jgi:hypothetical protein
MLKFFPANFGSLSAPRKLPFRTAPLCRDAISNGTLDIAAFTTTVNMIDMHRRSPGGQCTPQ